MSNQTFIFEARLLFTGVDVLSDAALAISDGRIIAMGPSDDVRKTTAADRIISTGGVILPGLVNAHTHLEYTDFAVDIADDASFADWLLAVSKARRTASARGYDWRAAAASGLRKCMQYGVTAVSDIVAYGGGLEARSNTPVRGRSYRELVRVMPGSTATAVDQARSWLREAPPDVSIGLSPHAPYSVSSEALRSLGDIDHGIPLHIHLAESHAEVEWVETGTGEILTNHERLGIAFELDRVGSGMSPVRYLASLGLLRPELIAAHAVYLRPGDAELLAESGTTVALCPRSNLRLQRRLPRVADLLDAGVQLCFGTDSSLSSPDLDVLEEVRCVFVSLGTGSDETAIRLLAAATVGGAQALGLVGGLRVGGPADFGVWQSETASAGIGRFLGGPRPRCVATFIRGRQEYGELDLRCAGSIFERVGGSPDVWASDELGQKARGLARLSNLRCAVPDAVACTAARSARLSRESWREHWWAGVRDLGPRLAVRSSFLDEDLRHASAAGAYSSLLDVANTPDATYDALSRVLKSAREESGSVIFQRYVPFQVSGVAFSVDPSAPDRCLIEWSHRAEAVTSGTESDVRRVSFLREAREARRFGPGMSHPSIAVVADELCRLHRMFPDGVDMEWGIGPDGDVHVLQARPITTAGKISGTCLPIDGDHVLLCADNGGNIRNYAVIGQGRVLYEADAGQFPADLVRRLMTGGAKSGASAWTLTAGRLTWGADSPPQPGSRVICYGRAQGIALRADDPGDADWIASKVKLLHRERGEEPTRLILVAASPDLRFKDHLHLFEGCVFSGGAALGHLSIILREQKIPSAIEPGLAIANGDWLTIDDGVITRRCEQE